MKISDKELQKIIHEELQEAVRKGEISQEELQQLQEANPIGFMGDVAKGLRTAAQAGIGKFKKERAKRLAKEKETQKSQTTSDSSARGFVGKNLPFGIGDKVVDLSSGENKPATKPVGPTAASAKLQPDVTSPAADAPKADTTAAAAPVSAKQPEVTAGDSSLVAPNQAQSIKQIADYKNFEKAFNTLNTTITNNKNLDPKELEGIVFTVNTKGQIVPMPGHMSLAQQAVKNAISKKQAEEFNKQQTSGEPQGLRESKNLSYQETYNKWQKLIKG